MALDISYIISGVIIMVAMGVESIVGYGGGMLALPFLLLFIPVQMATTLISITSMMLAFYVSAKYFKLIRFDVVIIALLFMAIGEPIGMFAFSNMPEKFLKIILGVFIVGSAIKGFYDLKTNKITEDFKGKKVLNRILLISAGVFHGAYGVGGPFIAVYAKGKIKGKGEFRATMATIFAIINIFVQVKNFIIGGVFTVELGKLFIATIPLYLIGIMVGSKLHGKVGICMFNILVNSVLLVAGISTTILAIMIK